ncbi:MAG: hypothetical protein A3B66_01660 [Alphaproteobacteria bacterium RIFCSPHIGHO2_02_FULL_46_13]|nr:MAG: hypothetical protein A3B66_01660 [Alphaproteobacteria bacterium RIFCSPHIGHO2_02_FULL_46_13]
MKLKMQSDQESIIESFLENSFGAPFLFILDKFNNGQEAADLAWVNNSFSVVFFMTQSNKEISYNIDHNLRQAIKFKNRWQRNMAGFHLSGINRYQERRELKYTEAKKIIYLSVISNECGISLINQPSWNNREIYINIPDILIRKLAEFGGTIIDMLNIIKIYFEEIKVEGADEKQRFEMLINFVDEYVSEAKQFMELKKIGSSGIDTDKMHMYLQSLKGASQAPWKINDDPAMIACIFGDLSSFDFVSLTSFIATSISKCNPPTFSESIVGRINTVHRNFVVAVISFSDMASAGKAIEKAVELAAEDATVFVFGDMHGINDYNYPMMMFLADNQSMSHADKCFENIRSLYTN